MCSRTRLPRRSKGFPPRNRKQCPSALSTRSSSSQFAGLVTVDRRVVLAAVLGPGGWRAPGLTLDQVLQPGEVRTAFCPRGPPIRTSPALDARPSFPDEPALVLRPRVDAAAPIFARPSAGSRAPFFLAHAASPEVRSRRCSCLVNRS
jgi:hypothetical protein